jgi:hypothetical protein
MSEENVENVRRGIDAWNRGDLDEWLVGGAVTGAAFVAKRFASSSGGADFGRLVERMPEDAPPKWIFRNVTAIRENTDRILELLESEERSAGGS